MAKQSPAAGGPAQLPLAPWRQRLHEIIFEADTPAGKFFDVVLLLLIVFSVMVVMLDSVAEIQQSHGSSLLLLEWIFTLFFTVEYVLRLISVRKPMRYAFSFFGLVDLLAVLPTYLSVIFADDLSTLMVIRVVRLLRVFRVFKMVHLLHEGQLMMLALRASQRKITVFLGGVLSIVVVVGTLMYLIEGAHENSDFTSIPTGMYWAIVTMTTVGYGDVVPQTVLGQMLASFLMILGYGILAVPTGIVTAEMVRSGGKVSTQACPSCSAEGHAADAVHCKFCGSKL